jgi:UDP-glucose 4-epimerase
VTPRRVLVTGGAGFIGSHLVDALLARGDDVAVVDNLSVGARENLAQHAGAPRFALHVADVLDKRTMHDLVAGRETVFHLATQCVRLSLFDPETVHRVNTEGTLNLLLAAVAAGVQRFVYVSSSEVFGTGIRVPMAEDHPFDPTTVYGASKLAGEHYTTAFHRTHGLPTVIARPFNTYGPRSHFEGAYGELIPKFVVRVLNGRRPIVFGDGEQTRDFTHVSDTVNGIVRAAESTPLVGGSVNIARGEEVTVNAIAALVLRICGREDLRPEHGPERPADVRRHYGDITRARQLIGFEPAIAIADGIAQYVAWFRAAFPEPARLLKDEQPYNWQPNTQSVT